MSPKRIVVLGYMGACPIAGVIWQHLHYIVGLQRLGHDVYYVEDTARFPYNPARRMVEADYGYAAKTLQSLADKFGFRDRWAFRARYLPQPAGAGLAPERLRTLYAEADAILNVCESHELHEDLLASTRLILVETDPGFVQVRVDQGDRATIERLERYQRLFTFGENVGTSRFSIPTHGFDWLPTRQPVVTDFWSTNAPPPPEAAFTTIMNWSASAAIEWRGKRYLWAKAPEFMKLADAPALSGEPFDLVTDIPDAGTAALFRRKGWRLVAPDSLNFDEATYRRYIQASKAEFTASKHIVVALKTGWFSDRSACYLAAGRPVVTQETGFTRLYGGDRGLFGFTTLEEALEAVRRIAADYRVHSNAAREIAQEHFEAGKVLKSLLDRAGL